MENESYKIVGLQVDGLRKLRAIEMKFAERGLTKIIGLNKQGKTSILESFAILFGGKKYLTDGAINPEADRLTMSGDLGQFDTVEIGRVGGFKIERQFREGKDPVLKVTADNGKILSGEIQRFLDSTTNSLTYSPFPFINLKPLEKLRFLMKLYNIDFTTIDDQLRSLEADRLYTGRLIKDFGTLIEPERVLKVSLEEMMTRRKQITDTNKKLKDEWDIERQGKKRDIDLYNETMRLRSSLIAKLKATAEGIQERAIILKNTDPVNPLHGEDVITQSTVLLELYEQMQAAIKKMPQVQAERILDIFALPEPKYLSTDDVDHEIQMAEATNLRAGIYQTYLNRLAEKENLTKEYGELSDQIEALRDEKIATLAAIDTKVEGLEIKIDGVYYFGHDTDNLSDAENMTLSLKLCAAMQPPLRAIFVDRGESIDENSRLALHTWAVENDIQLIISIVDAIPEPLLREDGCFYIEEGQLV